MLKYLRIAVTALSMTACVLLVALWVRSYWWRDSIAISSERTVVSRTGFIGIARSPEFARQHRRWSLASLPLGRRDKGPAPWMVLYKSYPLNKSELAVPIWMVLGALIVFTISAWLPWRFSLRTLLIATTLVAIGFGVVIYIAR
jgi:hypothetical protein